jgi:hypothetical protein
MYRIAQQSNGISWRLSGGIRVIAPSGRGACDYKLGVTGARPGARRDGRRGVTGADRRRWGAIEGQNVTSTGYVLCAGDGVLLLLAAVGYALVGHTR